MPHTIVNSLELRPMTPAQLATLAPADLPKCDMALMNLLCAENLRGAENLNVNDHLKRLDGIASRVDAETKRHYYKFRDKPAEFNHSEGYFRMLLMAVVLREDLGIQYNPARITEVGVFEPNEVFFADSRDVFIHGLLRDDRRMGTCSSLPVLYVAVGRRLGYPLKLVSTQNHLFVRWEDKNVATNSMADATYFHPDSERSFSLLTVLRRRSGFLLSSERLNTRATHIQCCPRQPREGIRADRFASIEERRFPRKFPANQVRDATASGYVAKVASDLSVPQPLISH